MTSTQVRAGTYRPGLDRLRGIAVAIVVASHLLSPEWGWAGRVGVSMFLTLSGFLITYLLVEEYQRTGTVRLGAFWERRIRRLLPALLAVVAFVVAVSPWLPVGGHSVLSALTYTSNWSRAAGGDLGPLGHTWSLSVEEQFYLAWPLVLLMLLRGGRGFAMRVCVIGAVGVAVVREVVPWPEYRIDNGTDMRADLLLWGCALGLAYSGGTVPRWIGARRTQALAIIGLVAVFAWAPGYLGRAAIGLTACTVIAGIVSGRTFAGLAVSPLRWLGQRSYAIYLWHLPVVALVDWRIAIPATVLLSAGSYRWIEQPFRSRRLVSDVPAHGIAAGESEGWGDADALLRSRPVRVEEHEPRTVVDT